MVKLRMLGKNKVLDASWEGLYLFIGYVDERKWLSLMKEDAYASSRDLMKINGNDCVKRSSIVLS
jgi:hypothetical protein